MAEIDKFRVQSGRKKWMTIMMTIHGTRLKKYIL